MYLDDILEAMNKRFYARRRIILNDRTTQDAVIRNLEIIGEALKLPEDLYTTSHNVEWRKIIAFRIF